MLAGATVAYMRDSILYFIPLYAYKHTLTINLFLFLVLRSNLMAHFAIK